MKSTHPASEDDMLPEYDFDYRKARPNRFATKTGVTVTLDPDVAEVFTTSEAVNKALRAIISAMPVSDRDKTSV